LHAKNGPRLIHSEFCRICFIARHNNFQNVVCKALTYAGLTYNKDIHCIPGSACVPADIFVHNGPTGIPMAVDVAVVSPLSSCIVNGAHDLSYPAENVNKTEADKTRKYKKDFESVAGRITFAPFQFQLLAPLAAKQKRRLPAWQTSLLSIA
jgi:hypothetical protein